MVERLDAEMVVAKGERLVEKLAVVLAVVGNRVDWQVGCCDGCSVGFRVG